MNGDGILRTVVGTGTALHTGVTFCNDSPSVFHGHDPMRADDGAHAAAGTLFVVELKGHHIWKIDKTVHRTPLRLTNMVPSQRTTPRIEPAV